jgi:hypothetical protein
VWSTIGGTAAGVLVAVLPVIVLLPLREPLEGIELPVMPLDGIEPLPVIEVPEGIEPLPVTDGLEGIEPLPLIVVKGVELAPDIVVLPLPTRPLAAVFPELPPQGELLAEDGVLLAPEAAPVADGLLDP